jgi:hypothetical protein
MKRILTLLLLLVVSPLIVKAQRVGYEMRTNGKSYFYSDYKSFELRHRVDLQENRFTYRHNFNLSPNYVFSVPLHYKIECNTPTLEPRFVYKFDNKCIWVQQEIGVDKLYNLAVALDIKDGNRYYRIGWDNSKTYRFRVLIKIE